MFVDSMKVKLQPCTRMKEAEREMPKKKYMDKQDKSFSIQFTYEDILFRGDVRVVTVSVDNAYYFVVYESDGRRGVISGLHYEPQSLKWQSNYLYNPPLLDIIGKVIDAHYKK